MTGHREWDALVGRELTLQAPDGRALGATLTACSPVRDLGHVTSFELTIAAPADVAAAQGTYLVTADGVDREPVFLVPTRIADGALELTATFSQLSEEDAP